MQTNPVQTSDISENIIPRRGLAARGLLAAALIGLLLIVAESLSFTIWRPVVHLAPDSRASELLMQGVHAPEQDSRGSYRWTAGESQFRLPHTASHTGIAILELRLGPTFAGYPVSSFTVRLPGEPPHTLSTIALDERPRRYLLAVPPGDPATTGTRLSLSSDTTVVLPDTRPTGLRVEHVALSIPGSAPIRVAPLHAAAQMSLLLLVAVMLAALAVPLRLLVPGLLLVAAVLAALTVGQFALLTPYLSRWLVALLCLALLTVGLLPPAAHRLRWLAAPPLMRALWGIALLACCIRLTGSLHPLFEAFDLQLNVGRFYKTLHGDLVVTGRSIEFRNNITVYPPGAYLVLLPGALLNISPPLLIQGGLAIIDGSGALSTGLLARALGAGRRAAIFSALIYAAIPIHLTALWFGLTAQIFGQALMAPLALALLLVWQTDRRPAYLGAGLLLSIALLMHIGVAVVVVAWLGLVWLIAGGRHSLSSGAWWRFAALVAVSGAISVFGIYGAVAVLKFEQLLLALQRVQSGGPTPDYNLIIDAFPVSFGGLGLLLIAPGLLLIWRRLPRGGPELVAGWIATVVFFLAIELASAIQVRYLYFFVPLACTLSGLFLAALAQRSQAGRAVAWAAVGVLLVQGSLAWYTAAAEDAMMSMIPLLR